MPKKNPKLDEKRKAYLKDYWKSYDKPRVTLTLSKQEHKEFSRVAEQEGIALATAIKNMALAYHQTRTIVPASLEETLREHNRLIRSVSNNVNQIAHRVNIDETNFDANELRAYLQQLDALVKQYVENKF